MLCGCDAREVGNAGGASPASGTPASLSASTPPSQCANQLARLTWDAGRFPTTSVKVIARGQILFVQPLACDFQHAAADEVRVLASGVVLASGTFRPTRPGEPHMCEAGTSDVITAIPTAAPGWDLRGVTFEIRENGGWREIPAQGYVAGGSSVCE